MTTIAENNPFDASHSLVGYLYQCRYALCASLNKLRRFEEFTISIESMDDVVFEKMGSAPELLQTKCHTVRAANLTDASPDLWRSVRIWCEGITDGRIPVESTFYLITTSIAPVDSTAYFLKIGPTRNVSNAIDRLNATENLSDNKNNAAAFAAYKILSKNQKKRLFENVFVIDGSPSITDLDKKMREEISFAVNFDFLSRFLDQLEGWWYRKIVDQLTGPSPLLTSYELRLEIENISKQLNEDNLPIDDDILKATIDATGFQEKVFVKQLKFMGIHEKRIFFAIENYFRASEQRSRWIGDYLVSGDELTNYDNSLQSEWSIRNLQMIDDFGPDISESVKTRRIKEIYKWAETGEHRPIRKCVTQPFVSRGTFQILSDSKRIIWHPDFDGQANQLPNGGNKK
jgi:hypothetical protein